MSAVETEEAAGGSGTGNRPAFALFALGEIVALVVYLSISQRMWFYLDEWDFLAHRTAFNVSDLFRPHNEHWVTLPVLVYRALWWVVGLHSYRPYQLVMILTHLAAALLVRQVMRRAGVRPWTATVVASILVFFGSGYQNIVLPFQITLVGSLVFGLIHLFLAGHDGPLDRRDYLGLAAGCAALMCSGVGVAMVIAVGFAVLIARGWRLALLHTVPLAVIYLVWFAAIGHEGYTGTHAGPGDLLKFVVHILFQTFVAMGHITGVGIAIGVVLVAGLFVAWRPLRGAELRRRAAEPFALLIGVLALLVITGYGRGSETSLPEHSRYLHLVTAMVLPALAVAADALMRRWRALIPVVLIVLLIGIPGNINVIVNYMHSPIITNQRAYKQMMLSLPRSPVATQVPKSIVPEQQLAHFVTIGWLLGGVASGRIPEPAPVSASDAAMDEIRLSLEQRKTSGVPQGYRCISATVPLLFRLRAGQSIALSAPSGAVAITPAGTAPLDAYPFHVVTVIGPILYAVRPVSFRTFSDAPAPGKVCAPPDQLRAAHLAAAL